MSKKFYTGFLLFYLVAAVIFGVGIILSLLGVSNPWFESYNHYYTIAVNTGASLVMVVVGGLIGWAFWDDEIIKYRVSEVCGIIGIILFLLSAGLLMIWPVFVWFFMIAGLLCSYSVIAYVFNMINDRIRVSNWERAVIGAVFTFVFLYFIGYKSNVRINKVFAVDPKHFPFTKTLAGIVELSPYMAIASLLMLFCFLFALRPKKESNSEVPQVSLNQEPGENNSGKNLFFIYNGVFASIGMFVFSLALIHAGDAFIKNAASVLDFNSESICRNISEKTGIIYLDNKYELILVDQPVEKQHIYKVQKCVL
ncbi:hypothetical protein CHU32_10550 [Superficieibacter electus]|uniref:Uncharacterized protein n=1 Tax=Superficieibacter electus TaxID=2022662 RepID=A0A2P5GR18_9ENTR|nr:hypothetical protein [Superficieibacter electus]POP42816.1 hypothetical protein CHU33_17915 [Superficieibacter electus]POP49021.1 hypothetical protein CHU32_10550 [Superficieibacter electus]